MSRSSFSRGTLLGYQFIPNIRVLERSFFTDGKGIKSTIVRVAAFGALLLSTCGTSVALAQPAGVSLRTRQRTYASSVGPVTIRQTGAAVRLWRCRPRVTSALSSAAPRGVSNADLTASMRPTRIGHKAASRIGDTARGETHGSAGSTRTADSSAVTDITGRGPIAGDGTSSGGAGPQRRRGRRATVRMAAARVAGPLVRVAARGRTDRGGWALRRQQRVAMPATVARQREWQRW